MTEGSPSRHIVKFSLPLLAGNALQQAYNLVDSLVVGNFVGKEALAAVGSTFIISFLVVSLFSGLSLGFTIVISQLFGAKNREGLRSAVDTAYIVALLGAIPVSLVGIASVRPLLVLLNTPAGPTMEMSATYLTVVFAGIIGTFGYNLNAGILQGLGDSVSSLVFLAVATVLNVVLDLLFVVVFGWGVSGVAWATIVSQAVSFLLGAAFIVFRLKLTDLVPARMRFDGRLLAEAARVGFPTGIQFMLFSIGTMVIQRLINGYGPAFMAGWSISGRIDSLAFMPIASFATAVTTFTGQNVGAGKFDRVRRGFRTTHALSALVCLTVSAVVFLVARPLMALFTPDAEVISVGVGVLRRLMPTYILLSVLFITNSVLRGAGESFWPFAASLVSFLFLRMPLAYLFDRLFGKGEIVWSFGVGWLVGCVVALARYRSGRWRRAALSAESRDPSPNSSETL